MPRGNRIVFQANCKGSPNNPDCNKRVATVRLHRQRNGKSWKDFSLTKYCPTCRVRTELKFKEERHSK